MALGARRKGAPYKGTRLHNIWRGMRQRCGHFKGGHERDLKHYKDKGIVVDLEWRESFFAFESWAKENGYSPELYIDRIDFNGNYEPANCRWVTVTESNRNKSTTLTQGEIDRIRDLKNAGFKAKQISRWTGIKFMNVFNLFRGYTFK